VIEGLETFLQLNILAMNISQICYFFSFSCPVKFSLILYFWVVDFFSLPFLFIVFIFCRCRIFVFVFAFVVIAFVFVVVVALSLSLSSLFLSLLLLLMWLKDWRHFYNLIYLRWSIPQIRYFFLLFETC
jgi:hypothetical protein